MPSTNQSSSSSNANQGSTSSGQSSNTTSNSSGSGSGSSSNYSIIKEGWGSRANFQASYGLKMTPEGMKEGNAILDAFHAYDRRK